MTVADGLKRVFFEEMGCVDRDRVAALSTESNVILSFHEDRILRSRYSSHQLRESWLLNLGRTERESRSKASG